MLYSIQHRLSPSSISIIPRNRSYPLFLISKIVYFYSFSTIFPAFYHLMKQEMSYRLILTIYYHGNILLSIVEYFLLLIATISQPIARISHHRSKCLKLECFIDFIIFSCVDFDTDDDFDFCCYRQDVLCIFIAFNYSNFALTIHTTTNFYNPKAPKLLANVLFILFISSFFLINFDFDSKSTVFFYFLYSIFHIPIYLNFNP